MISGGADYDESLLPADRLAQLESKYKDQIKLTPCACTWYFFMNERLPPFNNIKARQAVNYGIDRQALVQLFGGLGQTTQNFLPPNYPQYKKITYWHYDIKKAQQLVKSAGLTGTSVKVFGENVDPSKSVVEYLASVLNKIGYKASVKELAHGVYFTTIGNQATKAQTGWADWFQDYPSPIDWFDVLFNGNRITETHNNNYGNADYAAVDKKIETLKANPNAASSAVIDGWKQVDKMLVVDNAGTAPYANRVFTDFFGPKVDAGARWITSPFASGPVAALYYKTPKGFMSLVVSE